MPTPPMDAELFDELLARSAVIVELNGPQVEAWVSGLLSLLPDVSAVERFVEYCRQRPEPTTALLCRAIEVLSTGSVAAGAGAAANTLRALVPPVADQLAQSELVGAWRVRAPFGLSLVLGFDLVVPIGAAETDAETAHAILVEIGQDGLLEDLQLAGSARRLLEEASAADSRVRVEELDVHEALGVVLGAWPVGEQSVAGPGVRANEHFVRARLLQATGRSLAPIVIIERPVDVRRGHDDASYASANRAALSTLRAAMGMEYPAPETLSDQHRAWIAAIRGDAADLSPRERDALLWLEWADWLGAGIGLLRAGVGVAVDGASLVDYVNRCPEVSSTIHVSDRDYAEWAFDVAIELLEDSGTLNEGVLTEQGYRALGPSLAAAWGPPSEGTDAG